MFDVGFWELALIFGVGLMILGPERMPRVAAQIGRWIGRAQRTANQFRRKLQRELDLDGLMRDGIVPRNPRSRPATKTKSGNTPTTVGANPGADATADGDGEAAGASADASAQPATTEPSQNGATAAPQPPKGDQDPAPEPPSEAPAEPTSKPTSKPSSEAPAEPEAIQVGEAAEAKRS